MVTGRAELVVLPLGAIPDGIMQDIAAALTTALGIHVKRGARGPSVSRAFDRRRRQYHATRILELLDAKRRGAGREKVLAIADVDLYANGLNFVFGEAAPSAGLAIISLWRLNPERSGEPADQRLFETRAVREAVHEAGHLLGLGHCPEPRCVVSFSSDLAEVDAKSSESCSVCRSSGRRQGKD